MSGIFEDGDNGLPKPPRDYIEVEVEPGVKQRYEIMPNPLDYETAKPKIGNLAPLMTNDKSDWETPTWFFSALNAEFNFTIDVCATMQNRKVDKFFSVHQDAFKLLWHGTCWMNSPYGTGIGRWLAKAKASAEFLGSTVVCLVPARTDTNWWFDNARFGEVRFLKGRLKFEGAPTSAPFPSALIVFRPGLPRSTSYWVYKEIEELPGWSGYQLE